MASKWKIEKFRVKTIKTFCLNDVLKVLQAFSSKLLLVQADSVISDGLIFFQVKVVHPIGRIQWAIGRIGFGTHWDKNSLSHNRAINCLFGFENFNKPDRH